MNKFIINKQIIPETSRPYFLVEVFPSSDGYRSRICDGRFKTSEDAAADILRRNEERKIVGGVPQG